MNVLLLLNIDSDSVDWRARMLSNFSAAFFVLDGLLVASVEGFIQGIKFPEGDPLRKLAFASVGKEAKRFSRKVEPSSQWVWWNGDKIAYGSLQHLILIERAIRAKFEQNSDAMKALLETRSIKLVHELGHPEGRRTSLSSADFCDILTRIREEAFRTTKK